MNKPLIYAGIGSRETPHDVQMSMSIIASQLANHWLLRSGHADGADKAFAAGTANREIHLPWRGYNGATVDGCFIVPRASPEVVRIAAQHHPVWDRLSDPVRLLMCRNVTIVLGENLDRHARMVICWTPGGRLQGGTAQAMKVAYSYDIPVFNLALEEDRVKLCDFTRDINEPA